jgi:hypothetical protein
LLTIFSNEISAEALQALVCNAVNDKSGRQFASPMLVGLFVFIRQFAKSDPDVALKLAKNALDRE